MSSFKAVVFDMDGVLLDTESVCMECWKRAGEEAGLSGIIPVYRACIGCNVKKINAILKDSYPSVSQEKLSEFYERTRSLFHVVEAEKGLALMKGVIQTLDYLKEKGYRLAIASSTRREAVVRQLTAAKIIHYFEVIITGDQVAHSKPEPDIYLDAVKALGLSPSDCAAIEDSPNGVRSATSAGLKCVMVPDQIQPDKEISSLAWKVCVNLMEVCALF